MFTDTIKLGASVDLAAIRRGTAMMPILTAGSDYVSVGIIINYVSRNPLSNSSAFFDFHSTL